MPILSPKGRCMSEHYTQKFQDVLDLEHQHINASRERAEMPTDVYTALAISGGGILFCIVCAR